MIHDLRTILDGWEYEPGKISVRKIIGRDGREKIQTRVDLGVLQFELSGRPDGERPMGHESLLDYCEARLREHMNRQASAEGFELDAEQCRELRHEAHLYYQRFLSQFVLEDFEAVERDTARNLRALNFCQQYAASPHDRETLEPQRAYIIMMNTRAKTYSASRRCDHAGALRGLQLGVERIESIYRERGGDLDQAPELAVLRSLERELIEQMPADQPLRLKHELRQAIHDEDYERAAKLRDRLARANETPARSRRG